MPGGARNWARALTGGSFVIGLGYLLMKSACCPAHGDADLIATVPTEEQLYKELPPDLKRQVDAHRRAREAAEQTNSGKSLAQQLAQQQDSAGVKWAK